MLWRTEAKGINLDTLKKLLTIEMGQFSDELYKFIEILEPEDIKSKTEEATNAEKAKEWSSESHKKNV